MAGPGSRLEKVGTIYSRVTGLLRSGALKDVNKPIWYDVYAAFPPKHEPKYDRELPEMKPVNITYLEDFIRAKFYAVYGTPDVVDMNNLHEPSLSQRFIEKCQELEHQGTFEKGELFNAASEALKSEGFRLKTLEELQKEQEQQLRARLEEQANLESQKSASVGSTSHLLSGIFNGAPQEAEDTISEDLMEYKSETDKPHT